MASGRVLVLSDRVSRHDRDQWGNRGKRGKMHWVGRGRVDSIGNVARASRRQLVSINEKSTVRVTGVIREHPVVHVFLGTFGAIARSQESAGRVRGQASFQTGGLSVVVMAIVVTLGDVLQDDTPEAFDVQGTVNLDIVHLTGAQVALRSNPMACVIRTRALRSSSVVVVIKMGLLWSQNLVNEIISRLVSNV